MIRPPFFQFVSDIILEFNCILSPKHKIYLKAERLLCGVAWLLSARRGKIKDSKRSHLSAQSDKHEGKLWIFTNFIPDIVSMRTSFWVPI
jgi:hypothetical protein